MGKGLIHWRDVVQLGWIPSGPDSYRLSKKHVFPLPLLLGNKMLRKQLCDVTSYHTIRRKMQLQACIEDDELMMECTPTLKCSKPQGLRR